MAVCKGRGDYNNRHSGYIYVRRKKESVTNASKEQKSGWQVACVAQGIKGSKLWAKDLHPKAERGNICSQLCLLALWCLLLMGRVHLGKYQALKRRSLLLEVDRK